MKYFVLFILIYLKDTLFVCLFMPIMFLYFKKKEKQESRKLTTTVIEGSSGHKYNLIIIMKSYFVCFATYYLYKLSYIPMHRIRNFIYQHVCRMKMGDKVVIYYGAEVRDPAKITIGNGSIIGDKAILDGRNGIKIGENVVLASNVSIWTEQHDHRDPWFRCETQEHNPVIIDDRAWIGCNCVILHSVHIGEGAVVAAGAVVTKDVAPFSIVAGIPAKEIAKRNKDLKYIFEGNHRHFL